MSGASADAMNGVPTGDDLFRLGFADPLTGACRPGLAENSPPDCFPGAAALLKEKAGGRPLRRCDHMRLALTGQGEMELMEIRYRVWSGSEL